MFAFNALRKVGFGKRSLQYKGRFRLFDGRTKKNLNKPFDIQNTGIISISNVICSLVFGKRFDYVDAKLESAPETYSAFYAIYRYVVP